MAPEPIWSRDPLGAFAVKVAIFTAAGFGLWQGAPAFVALGVWTHIAVLAIFVVMLGAGIVWRHIEAVRAYERGEW